MTGRITIRRGHAVPLLLRVGLLLRLGLGALELNDELMLKILIPRQNSLCHLAKLWQSLRPNEKEISQINLALGTGLVDVK